ncbi:optineurin-like [Paramuricea clavata]|uniref:Optineurin-like n=1 Tax=Paramuricea clavata TaxID=317549 RepID=A0A6S7FM81_PARCT|nr:optineurin-like [Paramuricea clavata]
MDKDQSLQPETESYEFVNERDAQVSIRSDSSASTDAGIPLSDAEKALADRVRHLQQENKELRNVVDNYQKALQLYQESLNKAIAREGEILSDTQKKYNQAKSKVERQNEKISNLEKELQEEKNKHSKHEEVILDEKQQNEKNDCEKVDVSEKNNFEENVSSLHQLVGTLSVLIPDEYKTSMSPDLLQDLINLEKYIKALLKSDSAAPDRKNAFEDELESVKEQLKKEEQKRAELETRNKNLQDVIANKKLEEVDVQELQEEVQLLGKDMDKVDMLRAGCVSRDSETTDESFSLDQTKQQQSIVDSLKLKYDTLKKVGDQREKKFLDESEKLLSEKDSLNAKVTEMETEKEEAESQLAAAVADKNEIENQLAAALADKNESESQLAAALADKNESESQLAAVVADTKAVESQLAAAVADKNELEQKLADQIVYCDAIQEELGQTRIINEELETKLNENSKKENVENELKAQVFTLCQEIGTKDMECDDLKARLDLSGTECNKMNSALDEMRKELDAVYSQNEKLLTERKGASEAELVESRSKIDNLTAQLLSAEEMLEHKETDLRKSHEHQKSLVSELETVPLLKQQLDVYQADFNTERQTRQKVEDDNRKLRDEVAKLHADNERLTEEASDPTGSKLAEMQRRHGCGSGPQPGNDNNPWSGFYDQFLAPRGPAVARNSPHQPHAENDINRQVSGGRCPKCDLMFPDLDTLQTHVVGCLESESTGSVGGKICPKCQGSFPDLDTLQIHVMECLDN